jgi:hypothetical protein
MSYLSELHAVRMQIQKLESAAPEGSPARYFWYSLVELLFAEIHRVENQHRDY